MSSPISVTNPPITDGSITTFTSTSLLVAQLKAVTNLSFWLSSSSTAERTVATVLFLEAALRSINASTMFEKRAERPEATIIDTNALVVELAEDRKSVV